MDPNGCNVNFAPAGRIGFDSRRVILMTLTDRQALRQIVGSGCCLSCLQRDGAPGRSSTRVRSSPCRHWVGLLRGEQCRAHAETICSIGFLLAPCRDRPTCRPVPQRSLPRSALYPPQGIHHPAGVGPSEPAPGELAPTQNASPQPSAKRTSTTRSTPPASLPAAGPTHPQPRPTARGRTGAQAGRAADSRSRCSRPAPRAGAPRPTAHRGPRTMAGPGSAQWCIQTRYVETASTPPALMNCSRSRHRQQESRVFTRFVVAAIASRQIGRAHV